MNISNTTLEVVVSTLQFSFIYYIYSVSSLITALLVSLSIYALFTYYVKTVLKLIPLKANDKMLLGTNFYERQIIFVMLELENLDINSVAEIFKTRAFQKLDKLSYRLVYRFFNFYWQRSSESNQEILRKRLQIHSPMTSNELDQFISDQVQCDLDIFDTPIEIHLVPKAEDQSRGCLFIKSDHCFTDGMGIFSLLACVSDKYNVNMFPKIMQVRSTGFLSELIDFILFLLFGLIVVVYLLVTTQSKVKFNKKPRSKETQVIRTVVHELAPIKKKSKDMKVSINELILSALVSSIKSMYPEEKRLTLMLPFSMTPLPKSTDQIKMANYVSGIVKDITLIDDPKKDFKSFQKDYERLIKQAPIVKILNWGVHIFSLVLPFNLYKTLSMGVTKEIDFCCSSVPTTSEPLYYGKTNSVTAAGISSTGYLSFLYTVVTHIDKVSITGMVDKNIGLDSSKFNECFNSTLKSLLES